MTRPESVLQSADVAPRHRPSPAGHRVRLLARRLWSVPWKLGVGALFTQSWLGAILVMGWMQRWTCRSAVRQWWRLAGASGRSFAKQALLEPDLAPYARAPDWFRSPTVGSPGLGGATAEGGWLGALRLNFRLGVQALMNALALTLPGGVLMLLGWWGGWQNSFHKGYEQFMVGPVVSWLGLLLFVAAMFYVPMALARQAVTGRWREFWRGSTVWELVRHGWAGCAVLAVLAAVLNFGAMGLKAWPSFLPQARTAERVKALIASGMDPAEAVRAPAFGEDEPDWNRLTDDQARAALRVHYARSGLVVFLALMLLRGWAGRVYAAALVRAVRRGALGEEQLSETEWGILARFGLIHTTAPRRRAWPWRVAAWAASRTGRIFCAIVVFLGWLGFVVGTYVSAFLAYHPVISFLNQPLVQVPVFRYVPAHLEDPVPGLLLTALMLGVAAIVRWRSRPRRHGLNVMTARGTGG